MIRAGHNRHETADRVQRPKSSGALGLGVGGRSNVKSEKTEVDVSGLRPGR